MCHLSELVRASTSWHELQGCPLMQPRAQIRTHGNGKDGSRGFIAFLFVYGQIWGLLLSSLSGWYHLETCSQPHELWNSFITFPTTSQWAVLWSYKDINNRHL